MQKQKRNKFLIIIALCFLCCGVFAQNERQNAPVVREDGSVQFLYRDSIARSVRIYCDCRLHGQSKPIEGESYHWAKMKKDSAGVWSYITPPLTPEVYTYQFKVAGDRILDPNNGESIRVHRERRSMFIVKGTPQMEMYEKYSLAGRVDTLELPGYEGAGARRLLVYTPPQYADSTCSFPVLYLLHGINGFEGSWAERGRSVVVLDRLIAMQKAVPMIMVMPDANPECLVGEKNEVGMFHNLLVYSSWNKREFEKRFAELDQYLGERYRLSSEPGSRAAAGLSAGAKQAANLANMYDSTFVSVGLFSPVVNRRQIPQNTYTHYWVGVGKGDMFRPLILNYKKKIEKRQAPYTFYDSPGGHVWRNWRVYFYEYVQTLFRD